MIFRRCLPIAIVMALGGCGFQASSPFDRVAIRGTVTLDNQPLSSAFIHFIPSAGIQGPKVTLPIVDGVFESENEQGPVAGSHRVEIVLNHAQEPAHDDEEAWQKMKVERVSRKRPPELPAIYNERSTLTAIVEPSRQGDIQSLTFELKSR